MSESTSLRDEKERTLSEPSKESKKNPSRKKKNLPARKKKRFVVGEEEEERKNLKRLKGIKNPFDLWDEFIAISEKTYSIVRMMVAYIIENCLHGFCIPLLNILLFQGHHALCLKTFKRFNSINFINDDDKYYFAYMVVKISEGADMKDSIKRIEEFVVKNLISKGSRTCMKGIFTLDFPLPENEKKIYDRVLEKKWSGVFDRDHWWRELYNVPKGKKPQNAIELQDF